MPGELENFLKSKSLIALNDLIKDQEIIDLYRGLYLKCFITIDQLRLLLDKNKITIKEFYEITALGVEEKS